MKKASLVMITMTLIFCTFAAGFFLGRNMGRSPVSVSVAPNSAASTSISAASTPTEQTTPQLVNINTATVEQLMTLPGIGEVLARRIVAYRDANGPFESIAQLSNVEGIGDKKLENILPYITTGGQG